MVADFKVIVITPEHPIADEASRIVTLLDSGAVWRVHLRHPQASPSVLASILSAVPSRLYHRISLHDCYNLADTFSGVGVHLNARNQAPTQNNVVRSKSCHTLDEVQHSDCDYVTLSPIFNSISKAGYNSAFELDDRLKSVVSRHRVIALGGVTPDKFSLLKSAGFAGAALLGYVWQIDLNDFNNRIDEIYAAIHN